MKWSFAFFHWLFTLILAPFTFELIKYLFIKDSHLIVGLLEVYLITFTFSCVFSIPTLAVYLLTFMYLNKSRYSSKLKKTVLIGISILGIAVTMQLLFRDKEPEIVIAYVVTSLIIGLALPIKLYTS